MAGMTADAELGARLSATLAAAMEARDYAYADFVRGITGDLLSDGEMRLRMRAAIAEAEAADDDERLAQLAAVMRLADDFGVLWHDQARQVLGLDEES